MDMMELRRQIALNEPHLVTTTPAGIANFSTDMIAPLKSCKVEFSPVQSGSGDPSPDNVRPISGWTGCNITRCGKNLYNSSTDTANSFVRANKPVGEIVIDRPGYSSSDYIPVLPNTCYIINYNERLSANAGMVYYNSKKEAIRGVTLEQQTTLRSSDNYPFVTPQNCYFLRFTIFPRASNIQLELGSTATPYEPYTGSTIPIDWTTEAGTVYGGSLDVTTGLLTVDRVMIDIGTAGFGFVNNVSNPYFQLFTRGTVESKRQGFCLTSIGLNVVPRMTGSTTDDYAISLTDTGYIRIRDTNYSDISAFNSGMSGAQLVYELATPITYQLTPAQLKSLRGTNNIWSDANGNIEAKYWTH